MKYSITLHGVKQAQNWLRMGDILENDQLDLNLLVLRSKPFVLAIATNYFNRDNKY